MRMKMRDNNDIRPVRFSEDYCDSLFNPAHHEYGNYVPMTFGRTRAAAVESDSESSESEVGSDEEIVLVREDDSEIEEQSSSSSEQEDSSDISDSEEGTWT